MEYRLRLFSGRRIILVIVYVTPSLSLRRWRQFGLEIAQSPLQHIHDCPNLKLRS